MGIQIPDSERILTNNTQTVVWTKISGASSGDFFYISAGLPSFAAVLGSGTLPDLTVSGSGTRITLNGTVDSGTTYDILSIHGPGKARRFN